MTSQDIDSLDQILTEWEFELTGQPRHWEKTPERQTIDEKRTQALLKWRDRAVVAGKIEEMKQMQKVANHADGRKNGWLDIHSHIDVALRYLAKQLEAE